MKKIITTSLVICMMITIMYSDINLNYISHKTELDLVLRENNDLKEKIYYLKKQNENYKYTNYVLNSINNYKSVMIIYLNEKIHKIEKENDKIRYCEQQCIIPEISDVKKYTITAYSNKESSKYTSTGNPPRQGIVAASRDVIKRWGYGSSIYIFGVGEFTIDDTTHISKNNHIDIFMFKHSDATEFGVKKMYVALLLKNRSGVVNEK